MFETAVSTPREQRPASQACIRPLEPRAPQDTVGEPRSEMADTLPFQDCSSALAARGVTVPGPPADREARHWLVLIQAQDESALRRLHGAYQQLVYGCALGIVRREEVAHEIVSTSFMQVWKSAASYDPVLGSVVAWLLLITRSRSLDALRHINLLRRREVSFHEEEEATQRLPLDRVLEPLSLLERRQRQRGLQQAFLRLSPMQRQVVMLTTLEGLSHDDASRHLDVPLGTLKSHARRGLAALRQRCDATGLTLE